MCPCGSLVEAAGGSLQPQPGRGGGCSRTVPAWSAPGARGSTVCEQPSAFLGHVTAACAGWRLAAGAAGDVGTDPGRWPWGGRAVPRRASPWGFGRVLLADGVRGAGGVGLAPGCALGKHRGCWGHAGRSPWADLCPGKAAGSEPGRVRGEPARGLAWPQHGGSGEERGGRGCRHCHCHCRSRLAALWPPSSGMLGAPHPSGVWFELRGCWREPWGSTGPPAPEPGSGSSARSPRLRCVPCHHGVLIQGVCKKLGCYKSALCRRENGNGAGTVRGLLSKRG